MTGKIFFLLTFLLMTVDAHCQVAINTDGTGPHHSAILDVKSVSKGLLPPRMTSEERNAIVTPADGLIVFCTDCGPAGTGSVSVFMAGAWYLLGACLEPLTPSSGNHVALVNLIVWNWNSVTGASGYKWNTLKDYSSAIDMGLATTKTETGLAPNTAYTRYVWAYNACGNSAPVTLNQATTSSSSCGQPMMDSRDGKIYNTVLIGAQCWMAANLNAGVKIAGTTDQTNNGIVEKYCYLNDEANCNVYGGLYRWNEMMDYTTSSNSNPSERQGICPTGWHVPSDDEWSQLETFVEPTALCHASTVAGCKVREAGTSHWASPNSCASNLTGFTALPAGHEDFGSFSGLNTFAKLWTSLDYYEDGALCRFLEYNTPGLTTGYASKSNASSLRCVMD
jgi:uncharacterized protein (TIGR02145 family)